ncbi:MAG: hypothetical protein OHK0023_23720 [Anaerolineae bacterium]
MAHYVVLFSPESYQTFTAAPHSLIIPARRAAILKRVQVGDTLLAYLPALTRWIGALTVTAPAEPLDAFKMKVAVQVETWLPLERGVPVSHPRVWGSLTLTRGRDKDMTSAIPTLRTTFTPLDAADGQFLVSLLAAHAENEVIFSYDEAAYAKRIGQPLPRADGHQVRALVTDLHDMDIEELFSANIEARDTVRAQATLANVGAKLGFTIWIPHLDRPAIFREWKPRQRPMLDSFEEFGLDTLTQETLERFDMLWLHEQRIVRAFEIEHSYSVYLGILRIADFFALQPDATTRVHLVAPDSNRDKVFKEVMRPIWAMWQAAPLRDLFSFLSYESVRDFAAQTLTMYDDSPLDDFAEDFSV